jgi:hypothetical protein
VRLSIIEDPSVTAAIKRAFEAFERTDDAFDSILFAMERDGMSAGFPVEGYANLRFIETKPKPSIRHPGMKVLFASKNDTIVILSIRIELSGVVFHSLAFENESGRAYGKSG